MNIMTELALPIYSNTIKAGDLENVKSEPKTEREKNEKNVDLLQVKHIISTLSLTTAKVGEFLVIMRSEFDVSLSGEPYIGLMMLLDMKSGKFVSRVWNQTVATGSVLGKNNLMEACKYLFNRGRPCVGYPITGVAFPRRHSSTCSQFLDADVGSVSSACEQCIRESKDHSASDLSIKADKDDPISPDHSVDSVIADDGDLFHPEASSDYIGMEDFTKEYIVQSDDVSDFPMESENLEGQKEPKISYKEEQRTNAGIVKDTKIHRCPTCGKMFKSKQNLKEHETGHKGDRPYSCPNCGKSFKTTRILKSHMKTHMREKGLGEGDSKVQLYYDCDLCGKSLTTRQSLSAHKKICLRKQNMSEGEPITSLYHYCDKCGVKCSSQSTLYTHVKTMHMEGPFPCPHCGLEFAKWYLLKVHRAKEHKPRLQCDLCDYNVDGDQYSSLKKHRRKHFDPTFKCCYCGKMLKTEKNLESHERSHRGEKPFSCSVCDSSFAGANYLDQHMRGVHGIAPRGGKTGWHRKEKQKKLS